MSKNINIPLSDLCIIHVILLGFLNLAILIFDPHRNMLVLKSDQLAFERLPHSILCPPREILDPGTTEATRHTGVLLTATETSICAHNYRAL
eukprot:g44046.t1